MSKQKVGRLREMRRKAFLEGFREGKANAEAELKELKDNNVIIPNKEWCEHCKSTACGDFCPYWKYSSHNKNRKEDEKDGK